MRNASATRALFGLRCTTSILLGATALFCADAYALENSLEWLSGSVDSTRGHDIGVQVSWHARIMMLAWGILIPLGVIAARFFKIWPGQNWPIELDRREWWYAHLLLQVGGAVLAVGGLVLIYFWSDYDGETNSFTHRSFGWLTMSCLFIQISGGVLRGTSGGPTYPAPDGSWRGDHYDMTWRRKTFERIHKVIGYLALVSGCITITLGLWMLNAPRWMCLVILLWWLVLIVCVCILQKRGYAIDTYQAIWGTDSKHPGNRSKPIGFGVRQD